MAYVEIFLPGREPQRHELERVNVFGRSSSNDIWVDDPNASRRHCKLQRVGVRWLLTDLDSTNGTWLDAARVRRYALRDGETFYIGDARVVFYAQSRVENRPADPHESVSAEQAFEDAVGDLAHVVCEAVARRPLPSVGATVVGCAGAPREEAGRTYAFRRAPAMPIVRGDENDGPRSCGGWVGDVLARIRGG